MRERTRRARYDRAWEPGLGRPPGEGQGGCPPPSAAGDTLTPRTASTGPVADRCVRAPAPGSGPARHGPQSAPGGTHQLIEAVGDREPVPRTQHPLIDPLSVDPGAVGA